MATHRYSESPLPFYSPPTSPVMSTQDFLEMPTQPARDESSQDFLEVPTQPARNGLFSQVDPSSVSTQPSLDEPSLDDSYLDRPTLPVDSLQDLFAELKSLSLSFKKNPSPEYNEEYNGEYNEEEHKNDISVQELIPDKIVEKKRGGTKTVKVHSPAMNALLSLPLTRTNDAEKYFDLLTKEERKLILFEPKMETIYEETDLLCRVFRTTNLKDLAKDIAGRYVKKVASMEKPNVGWKEDLWVEAKDKMIILESDYDMEE